MPPRSPPRAPVRLAALAAPDATAQQWRWPDDPENLQVLPETITSRELAGTMIGFVRALGVRCTHCHVGEEGEPLSTYDFAADDKEAKETTRLMLKMVNTINAEHLADLGDDRLAVTCATCHRGQEKPRMLEDVLAAALAEGGVDGMVARYHELREQYYGGYVFDFSERALNRLGYSYLNQENHEVALALFHLNAEAHPTSGDAYDSLADGYMTAGDTERAITFYQQSLELNPANDNAVQKLKELRGGE